MSMWSRVANMFRSGRVERELDEELQFHIEGRIAELMATGMTREAAAREVARRFGSPLRLREESLEVKLLPWLDSMIRDVASRRADVAEGRRGHGRRRRVAVARPGRVRGGFLAGRRADPQATARA